MGSTSLQEEKNTTLLLCRGDSFAQNVAKTIQNVSRGTVVLVCDTECDSSVDDRMIAFFRTPKTGLGLFFDDLLVKYDPGCVVILPGGGCYPAGVYALVESMKKSEARKVIFGSTYEVYGRRMSVPFSPLDRDLRPITDFGRAALKLERKLRKFAGEKKTELDILRFFALYGLEDQADMVYRSAELMIKGRDIPLEHGGDDLYDYLYYEDAIRALTLCVTGSGEGSIRLFNIGTGEAVSQRQMLSELRRVLFERHVISSSYQVDDHIEEKDSPYKDIFIGYADILSAEKQIPWNNFTTLYEGLCNVAYLFKRR